MCDTVFDVEFAGSEGAACVVGNNIARADGNEFCG